MNYFDSLWNYLIISAPYLILGLIFSGFIHAFITVEQIKKWLGKKKTSDIFLASAIGVPLPLCSCSVIPIAVTLKKAGASNGATSAFLISTPESGVDSMVMTYGMIDLPMTIIRPVAAFASAIVAGFLQLFFNKDKETFEEVKEHGGSCCHKEKISHEKKSLVERLKSGMRYAFVDLINDLSFWLTVGILLGALIDYLVPADYFLSMSTLQTRAMILLIGVPLYICASATTPIAASLMIKGLGPGSALLLLLVGPATSVSNIAVLQKYIGKKGVILNIIAVVVVALIFAEITDYVYSHFVQLKLSIQTFHEHSEQSWWKILSVIILIFLLAKGLYAEEIKPRFFKGQGHDHQGHQH